MKFLSLLLGMISLWAHAQVAPTRLVTETLHFEDDLNFNNFSLAVKRQLKYFEKRGNLQSKFTLGKTTYQRIDLKNSLLAFETLVNEALECQTRQDLIHCISKFSTAVNEKFLIYKPIPKKEERGFQTDQTFFTSYYSPSFEGSFTRTERFSIPIYKKPQDRELLNLTRVEIDFDDKLAGKGLELVYIDASLYDLWLMHVEGGARVFINENGERKTYYLSYETKNNQPFRMLSKYMLDAGMLKPGASGIDEQREYLANNPQRAREVFEYCPSYIFFNLTKIEPVGVHRIPLTDNRSLATDYRIYDEYGLLTYVKMKKAVRAADGSIQRVPFSRFFINQDTGGAIRGNARSDLYFGHGPEAELAAKVMSGLGEQYFLILK